MIARPHPMLQQIRMYRKLRRELLWTFVDPPRIIIAAAVIVSGWLLINTLVHFDKVYLLALIERELGL